MLKDTKTLTHESCPHIYSREKKRYAGYHGWDGDRFTDAMIVEYKCIHCGFTLDNEESTDLDEQYEIRQNLSPLLFGIDTRGESTYDAGKIKWNYSREYLTLPGKNINDYLTPKEKKLKSIIDNEISECAKQKHSADFFSKRQPSICPIECDADWDNCYFCKYCGDTYCN